MQRLSREPYYKDPYTLEYVEDVAKSLLNLGKLFSLFLGNMLLL